MNFNELVSIMENKRPLNANFSRPFIVDLIDNNKVVVWFQFKIKRTGDNDVFFSHIRKIFIADGENVSSFSVILDVPCAFSQEPIAPYKEYLSVLEDIYSNFSREKMDKLFQEKYYQPLYKSYECVVDYVRTHYMKEGK